MILSAVGVLSLLAFDLHKHSNVAILQPRSWCQMFGQLISTETLIDRPCVTLTGKIVLTTNDVIELEQIQRELQSRADDERWIRSAN